MVKKSRLGLLTRRTPYSSILLYLSLYPAPEQRRRVGEAHLFQLPAGRNMHDLTMYMANDWQVLLTQAA